MDSSTLKRSASTLDEEKVEPKRTRQEEQDVVDRSRQEVEDRREVEGKYVAGSRKSPVSSIFFIEPYLGKGFVREKVAKE